ncbi:MULTISPECIES: universal stress protein [Nitrosomonas]|uniref:Nucleotide-binding universal stress UspA family protein n=1 Tax=Nitrosomonas communis TaxID=44574 RepID=A0A0F7KC53_9PROT|nr:MULTISPECIES: universal stress protein [Nitrosomonas]AKH36718.1 universal stress protein [Nitrosomonas communis]TYP73693.1 nucleotide-binding universal stress UspA family protein [Nitrosomonas communis]UVS61774.1 universal stress protein [Nitrosomonas sp. PLL12]
MTTIASSDTAPRRLLLATDLSARCDRALDQASQLAEEWSAELIALNILDPTASPDQVLAWASGTGDEQLLRVARQQLARDLKTVKVPVKLYISRSKDVPATIRRMAAETQSDVVVTGVSRNETLGRFLLGSTVEKLARSLPIPLLVVHNRAYGLYRRIVVATDFSESSRHALLAAVRFFPGRELIVYHAHTLSMAGLADVSTRSSDVCVSIEDAECASFLSATVLPEGTKLRTMVEDGAIETTLTRYVREHEIDLVVMGSHGNSGIMSLLLGSTAAKLLDWLPCDMLLVPDPRARG